MAAGKINDSHIAQVAAHLGEWPTVAKNLGFGGQEIEDIETDHRGAPADQRKTFLRKWIRKNGTKATYEALAKVVEKFGNKEDADAIRALHSKRDPASVNGQGTDSPGAQPTAQLPPQQQPHPQPQPPPQSQPPQPQPPTQLPGDVSPHHRRAYCPPQVSSTTKFILLSSSVAIFGVMLYYYYAPWQSLNKDVNEPDTTAGQNYKGLLQELLQKNKCPPPEYREIEKTGDPHMPVFTIRLTAVWQGMELKVEKSARKKQDAEKEAANEMYEMIMKQNISASSEDGGNDNAKKELQEMVQKQPGHPVPRYDLISQKGPSHQPVFQVKGTAQWNGEELEEEGQGNTIKAAEKNAAERLLLRIRGKKQPPLPPVSEVKIPDTDISRVAGILPNWQIVAKKLGFGEQDIEDIETSNQATADQRKAFVRKWIRKNGTKATYGKLCTALEELGEHGAAESIIGEIPK